MYRNDFLGSCQRVIELANDSCYLVGCAGGEIDVGMKMFRDDVRSRCHFLLGFKELRDVGATPLDESLELRKVGDVPLLYTCQGVEGDPYGMSHFPQA